VNQNGGLWSCRPLQPRAGGKGRGIPLSTGNDEQKIQNLTTEIAEYAEIKTDKGPGDKEKRNPPSNASRKAKTPKGLSEKDLCALRFLAGPPLFFILGGPEEIKLISPQGEKNHKPQRSGRTQRG
jgi:hypothetical protein